MSETGKTTFSFDRRSERIETERRGAIAVIPESDGSSEHPDRKRRCLVIRRSSIVVAPNQLCFPGGGVEDGETPEEAVIREVREELGVPLVSPRFLWESWTPWNVHLYWFLASVDESNRRYVPNREVAEIHWMTLDELAASPDCLESNRPFLSRLRSLLG